MTRGGRYARVAYLFVAPALVFYLVFLVGPLFFAIYLSFHRWDMLSPLSGIPFIGFSNYLHILFEDVGFRQAARNTFWYMIATLAITLPLALGLALLLNQRLRWKALWRTIYFIPVVTPTVAIAIVWAYVYNPTYGLLNNLLLLFGLPPQPWLSSPEQALACVIAVTIWSLIGYYAVIFLAGLQQIPEQYYEAATIDGAGRWDKFRWITLPLLKPTFVFVILIMTINTLQVFVPVYVMTNGGPVDASNVVLLHMWNTAFKYLQMGEASAMAVILFIIILVLSLVELKMLRQM